MASLMLRSWRNRDAILIGILIGLASVGIRLALDPWLGMYVPFIIILPAVGLAAVVLGRWGGIAALVVGQLAGLFLLIPPRGSLVIDKPEYRAALIVATLVGLGLIYIMSRYRRAIRLAMSAENARRSLLELTLRDMDHRSRNDFQVAVALLRGQARAMPDQQQAAALELAASRLIALVAAHDNVAVLSDTGSLIDLADYCLHLINGLQEAVGRSTLHVETVLPSIAVPREKAIALGLVLSDLLYGAIKQGVTGVADKIIVMGSVNKGLLVVQVTGTTGDLSSISSQAGPATTGSTLVAAIIEQMHGSIVIHADEPLRAELHLPISR